MLESLEMRRLLSAAWDPTSHTLTVNGVSGTVNDEIRVHTQGANYNIQIVNVSATYIISQADVQHMVLDGGAGDDVVSVDDDVALGASIIGGTGDDVLDGGSGNDTIEGGAGWDTIDGAGGDDLLRGGDEADVFTSLAGHDTVHGDSGGDDRDVLIVAGKGDLTLTNSAFMMGGTEVETFDSIEEVSVTGGDFDDVIDASAFTGGPATLYGSGGNDKLISASSGGMLIGEDGNDTLIYGQGGTFDSVMYFCNADGGTGKDTLTIDDRNYTGTQGFEVTSSQISRTNSDLHNVGYASVEGITLYGGVSSAGKTHSILSTRGACRLDLVPGDGFDTFSIVRTSPTGPVHIHPSGGLDQVSIQTRFGNPAYVVFPSSFTFAQRLGQLAIGIFGHVELAAGGDSRVLAVDDFSISHDATLDLHDHDFALYDPGALEADVEEHVRDARNGGLWDGTSGITSTEARFNPSSNTTLGVMSSDDYKLFHGDDATFDGLPLTTPAVLVKYTYYGDANFSGAVDFDDYVQIDVGFNTGRTGWSNGDFNLDGTINFDDYVLIDVGFNTQASPLRSMMAAERPSMRFADAPAF